jgi:hypothetical protein
MIQDSKPQFGLQLNHSRRRITHHPYCGASSLNFQSRVHCAGRAEQNAYSSAQFMKPVMGDGQGVKAWRQEEELVHAVVICLRTLPRPLGEVRDFHNRIGHHRIAWICYDTCQPP